MKLEIGDRVGQLEIIGPIVTRNGKESYSLCRCDCGTEWTASRGGIRKGQIKSCGCHARNLAIARLTTHGQSSKKRRSAEYQAWDGMIQRCTNPNSAAYPHYGARGITVCAEWVSSFETFFADMGVRPGRLTLERKDNSMGYSPDNCVWATRRQQMRNTRYTRLVDVDGEMLCVRDAAVRIGVPEGRIYGRVFRCGISHQEALDQCRDGGTLLNSLMTGATGPQ